MKGNWLGLDRFPELTTQRLLLREIRANDFASFHSLFKDKECNEHIQIGWAQPAEARKYFLSFRDRFGEGRGIRWSLVLRESGEWIGNLGFHNVREGQNCIEAGIQIVSSRWRGGYGSEAFQGALDWVLTETRYRTVDAWTAEGNSAAQAMLRGRGFSNTGEKKPFHALTVARFSRSF